jgi:alpha-methylacyl-CoA racemase
MTPTPRRFPFVGKGPLRGVRIIELASYGPAPFGCMMLADLGAEVIRVDRPGPGMQPVLDPLARNRRSLACNLKEPAAAEAVRKLAASADGFVEGFRPGVTERLGLGPEDLLGLNPGLVYGRMTGWGQDGPLAHVAGHDINYVALTGVLNLIGEKGRKPIPPLNLVADFGGGGMLLALGMVCAILHARATGQGQVVDAAMVDGVNALASMFHGFRTMGMLDEGPGESFLGGAAHWYDTYETKDGRYVSIAPVEPQFYELMIDKLELDRETFAPHAFRGHIDDDVRAGWAELKPLVAVAVKKRTLAEWRERLEGTDLCFAPVLTLDEAIEHPHNVARRTFVEVGGNVQAAPAPRFSETPNGHPQGGVVPGTHSREVLESIGYSGDEIEALIESGAVHVAS